MNKKQQKNKVVITTSTDEWIESIINFYKKNVFTKNRRKQRYKYI